MSNIKINVSSMYTEERCIKTSKMIFFQPTCSSPGSRVAGACPGSSGHQAGTHPDRTPFHPLCLHSLPHSLRLRRFRHVHSPHVHISGEREENGGFFSHPFFFLIKTLFENLLYILFRVCSNLREVRLLPFPFYGGGN